MRFLTPPQTISEYRHQRMPVYETLAAVGATTIAGSLTVGGLASAAATAGAGALAAYGVSELMGGGGARGMPSYGYNAPSGSDIFQSAAYNALANAPGFTQQNINLQNKVTPGSSDQRASALKLINSYMAGEVPLDVQQNINRQVAQNLGGGFNLFSGGGQAPQNFARNIGQTSVGLSQYGLSAAPTWQQLANSMVTRPDALMGFGIKAHEVSLGGNLQAAENQYQSQANKYLTQQAQGQQNQQLGMQLGQMALNAYNSYQQGQYLNSLSPSKQGEMATVGGFGGLPSATSAASYMSDLGYNPTSFTALPNTGAGTAYPFG